MLIFFVLCGHQSPCSLIFFLKVAKKMEDLCTRASSKTASALATAERFSGKSMCVCKVKRCHPPAVYAPAFCALSPIILRSEEQRDFACTLCFASVIARVACTKPVYGFGELSLPPLWVIKETRGFKNNSSVRKLCTCYCRK